MSVELTESNMIAGIKEISGQIVFTLSEIDSIPDGQRDSIYYSYTIQIADRAGNLSNEVVTPLIFEHY